MIFNSFSFAVFFLVVFTSYAAAPTPTLKKLILLVASYLFYSAWNPPILILLLISTGVDWWAALRMHRAGNAATKRSWLVLSLVSNLGMLGVFKYAGFFLLNVQWGLEMVGVNYVPPEWSVILPVGISFYTFCTLSYTIDVYRGHINPDEYTFLDFALFIAFFPHLVAGPIVRADRLLPQLKAVPALTSRGFVWGAALMTLGLFQKSVLADAMLARVADLVFAEDSLLAVDAWVGTLAFTGQIFFDFAGYSTCAIGVAMCFGYTLPDNFWFPYGAVGFSDFWRRWHISLSTWLRDYLYISLGGNRLGSRRTMINLALTMLLGGLWHGASWNFVLWGALHGGFLVAERLIRGDKIPQQFSVAGWFFTQLAVLLAWVPFRAQDFHATLRVLEAMVGLGDATDSVTTFSNRLLVVAVMVGTYGTHILMRRHRVEEVAGRLPAWLLGVCAGVTWVLIWLAQPDDRAFIYFQF